MQGNFVLFIFAGHDTTATALSFLAYELAMSPDIQDRVVAEIAEVFPEEVHATPQNMHAVLVLVCFVVVMILSMDSCNLPAYMINGCFPVTKVIARFSQCHPGEYG